MIANEQEYGLAMCKERSFRQAIERFDARGSEASDVHPCIRQAEQEAMASQLEDLRA